MLLSTPEENNITEKIRKISKRITQHIWVYLESISFQVAEILQTGKQLRAVISFNKLFTLCREILLTSPKVGFNRKIYVQKQPGSQGM